MAFIVVPHDCLPLTRPRFCNPANPNPVSRSSVLCVLLVCYHSKIASPVIQNVEIDVIYALAWQQLSANHPRSNQSMSIDRDRISDAKQSQWPVDCHSGVPVFVFTPPALLQIRIAFTENWMAHFLMH
jgi:hypothetical protein